MNNIKKEWWVITYLQVRRWDLRPCIPVFKKYINPTSYTQKMQTSGFTFLRKLFIPITHQPTLRHSQNTVLMTFAAVTNHVGLPNYV